MLGNKTACRVTVIGLLIGAAGCGGYAAPPPGLGWQSTAVARRADISDPKLKAVANDWKTWALQQTVPPARQPLFSRAEALPVTMTTLPYGVGANEQQPRLPVILTTGAGWATLTLEQKEKQVALAYQQLADRLQKAGFDTGYRPTLTLQTPQGMVLAWINDLPGAGRLIHGDNN